MSDACTVLIAAADLLPALSKRSDAVHGEVLGFPDHDAVRALDAIVTRRPLVVVLEKAFASTPRGVALVNRIKADPALVELEIRVVSSETADTRVLRKGASAAAARRPEPVTPPAAAAPIAPLDQRGTRRAPRFRIAPALDILVDGNPASLVDLSSLGAQVVSASVLKPNQRVRVALNDDQVNVRFNGSVAWARFEIPPGSGPRYRAGIEFVDGDPRAVDAFCARHKAS